MDYLKGEDASYPLTITQIGSNNDTLITVRSRDIKALANLPEFTIVRIFTCTLHNMFPDQLGNRKPFTILKILTKTRHNCEVEGRNGFPEDIW